MDLDKAIIFLKEDGKLKPTAALEGFESRLIVGQEDGPGDMDITPSHQQAFEAVEQHGEPVNVKDPGGPTSPFAVVPILREDDFLGLIEVDSTLSNRPIADEELETVASFALQAAVAISDAQMQRDFGQWKGHLEDVLKDVEPIDDLSAELEV